MNIPHIEYFFQFTENPNHDATKLDKNQSVSLLPVPKKLKIIIVAFFSSIRVILFISICTSVSMIKITILNIGPIYKTSTHVTVLLLFTALMGHGTIYCYYVQIC